MGMQAAVPLSRTLDRTLADPRAGWAIAAGLTVLFVLLCAQGLNGRALWNDEAFSFFVAWRDVAHTLDFMRQDTQPPLYYLALTFWLQLGHDPATLRALSVAAMAPVPLLLFDAARRLFGVRVALVAVLLFVLAPDSVSWAQKARPYALQALLAAIGFWGFVRIWTAGPRPPASGWAAYVLGGGLALLAQYPAVFFLLGCNAAMAARVATGGWAARRLARHWVLAQLAMGLLWLPWLLEGIEQVTGHLTPAAIASRHASFLVDAAWMRGTLTGLLAVPYLWRGAGPFSVLCGLLALSGIVALARVRRGEPPALGALPVLGVVLVPLAVCLLAWALVHPVFGYVTYTFLWLRAPYAMLLAVGALALRPRPLGAAALALLLLGECWGLANYKATRPAPLDDAAALIAAAQRPGDGLLLSNVAAARWGLAYYLGPPYAGHINGLDVAGMPAEGWPIDTPEQALRQARLWVVLPDGEVPPFDLSALAPTMALALHRRLGGLTVDRYDRAGP
jgi:mannosyltransferase